MKRYATEPSFTHQQAAGTAVLLINLGTPDAPTASAVRPYLKEFLSDPRVVEIPKFIWWWVLHGIILPLRSKTSAQKYASIWLPAEGARPAESPLLRHTQAQADALQARLTASGQHVQVAMAMRYGNPAIPVVLQRLRAQGVTRILCLPLYPQYSGTTTATAYDAVFAALAQQRNQMAVRTVKHYHDHPAYLAALQAQVADYWAQHGRPNFAAGEKLVLSFHGVPKRTLTLGDPYHCECLKTGRLLGEALGLSPEHYLVTFQSRFGKAEWLQPYTAPTLQALGQQGTTRVDVFCPGFPADCLETLEEINLEVREAFLHAGGGAFHYIPCLNQQPVWLAALATLALENLGGWLQAPASVAQQTATAARAVAKGAAA